MTITEAIRILENRKKQPFISYNQQEAFQMAINALKEKEGEDITDVLKQKPIRL